MNPSPHEEKAREEAERDRIYEPLLRWKHLQEMITWAEANLPAHLRRNRPRVPRSPLCFWLIFSVMAWLLASTSPLGAEDWQTTDGKVYQNVTVIKSEPDAVTILHRDGGALVPLANLPPELQKRFNYDEVKAKIAADTRARQEIDDAKALRAEAQAIEMMRSGAEAAAGDSGSDSDPATADAFTESSTPSTAEATHHTMDEITSSAQVMHRDFYDPTYHTMAHLVLMIHSLGPDPTDPNHHTMGEIAGGGL